MRRLISKPLAAALMAFSLLLSSAAAAQDVNGAKAFIQNLADQALALLAEGNADQEGAVLQAQDLLRQGFDLQTIGRFVIGRYWNVANPEQQQEYMRLFEQYVVETYTSRFDEYEGSTFSVGSANPISDTDVNVSSVLNRPGAPPLTLGWRIRDRGDNRFQIVDVTVEGVSMVLAQRDEFGSVIQRSGGNFDALLQALRQRVAA